MGYTTEFRGELTFDKPLSRDQISYINLFCRTRRMKRDVTILNKLYEGKHGLNGDYGREGEYFAMDDGDSGQIGDASVISHNVPPCQLDYGIENYYAENEKAIKNGEAVPGLWCQWEIAEDGTTLQWDGGEKFYKYTEWLKYLIKHFFDKWGNKLNGTIKWRGEDFDDSGEIIVENSIVKIKVNSF